MFHGLQRYTNENRTFNSVLGGGYHLTKVGTGTMTLAANNTYTGITKVNGGTIWVKNSGSISAASTLHLNGGTLLFETQGLGRTINSPVIFNGGTLTSRQDGAGFGGTITFPGANVRHTFTVAGDHTLTIAKSVTISLGVLVAGGGGGSGGANISWGSGGGGGK